MGHAMHARRGKKRFHHVAHGLLVPRVDRLRDPYSKRGWGSRCRELGLGVFIDPADARADDLGSTNNVGRANAAAGARADARADDARADARAVARADDARALVVDS